MDTITAWQISSFSDLEKEINETLAPKQIYAYAPSGRLVVTDCDGCHAPSGRLVVTDCDGCLTNGRVLYFDDGNKARDFSVIDGHGFQMLKKNGFDVVILSGESDDNIAQRAKKLGVYFLHGAGKDKIDVLKNFISRNYIESPEIYVLGDDVNDLSLLSYSVLFATPKYSVLAKKFPERVDLILSRSGGDGAFREFAEEVLSANGIDPYASFR